MGRKKFNKKDAAVYHLVRRSQQDVGGYFDDKGEPIEKPSDFVLIPSHETLKRAKDQKGGHHVLSDTKQEHTTIGDYSTDGADGADGADDALARAKKKLTEANLVDDYDYEQHMKPISGSGVFISPDGTSSMNADADANANTTKAGTVAQMDYYTNEIRSQKLDLIDPMIKEVDRQLDSIALTADCMDDDVAIALFGEYEEGEYEEILDDFCFTANQMEPIHEIYDGNEDGGDDKGESSGIGGSGVLAPGEFDFDAHIDKLIAKAKLQENGGAKIVPQNHEAWKQQQKIFEGVKPLRNKRRSGDLDSIDENDDDEDSLDREFGYAGDNITVNSHNLDYFTTSENPGIVAKLNPEEEKALCDKFEQTLLEYDSDHVGDLDDECYEIKGDKPLEGDRQIEAALDQFLQDKNDENFMIGSANAEKRKGGSSLVYVNNKVVPYNTIDKFEGEDGIDEGEQKVEEVLAEADEVLANPEMDLPPEEVLIDGKSYFTMKERNPWDCESILSTYSNLDNNPAVVGRTRRRRNKKKGAKKKGDFDQESIGEERPVQILLSNKTGLPLGVLPGPKGFLDDQGEETFVSVNKGEARKKGESKEEKKARKLLVKQERQVARIQKKMMREAIQEEFGLRTQNNASNDVGGKSVFKYS